MVAATARALPLQEIISRTEPAVVHVSVLVARGAERGSGSGFVVSADGRVVTNHHVVERAERVKVAFQDGRKLEVAGVLAFDEAADLALLQLPKGNYPKLSLARSPVKQGDPVIVIGSPLGFSGTLSTGIVSALRPEGARLGDEVRPSWTLQLSAPISPGSSGSPIMNENGEVVAVAVGVVGGGPGVQALNFGVPIERLNPLLESAPKEPKPFRVLSGGRSRATNLLISLAGLGGVALIAWIASWLLERKRRRARRGGRDVIDPILKH